MPDTLGQRTVWLCCADRCTYHQSSEATGSTDHRSDPSTMNGRHPGGGTAGQPLANLEADVASSGCSAGLASNLTPTTIVSSGELDRKVADLCGRCRGILLWNCRS